LPDPFLNELYRLIIVAMMVTTTSTPTKKEIKKSEATEGGKRFHLTLYIAIEGSRKAMMYSHLSGEPA
jgi:hypothetical protein